MEPEAPVEEYDELIEDQASVDDTSDGDSAGLGGRRIFTDKSDPPVGALRQRYDDGDLVLDPVFQRRPVWDRARASRLIESMILEVPLPVFYLAESSNGVEEVIDGQQRLRACFDFLNNHYALRGLKARPDLNGKFYKDLDKPTQKRVRNTPIHTITFKRESDEDLRFEIFERLNTGAVALNRQELRNCVYRGPYNNLLIELSGDPDYMYLMGLQQPEKRMRDVEYVLRFAAFYHATYLKYKPPMAQFLDKDMRVYRTATEQDQEQLREAFKTSVTLIRSLLGEHAFRRYYRGEPGAPNGRWEPRQFNASLYDVLMFTMADRDKNLVMANLDAIGEAFIALVADNDDFIESIELSTSSVKMVTRRFDMWRKALDEVLSQSSRQSRCFTRELKKQLYALNPTCALCGQHIVDLDDAQVDHVEQYWLGGKTIEANARLTHRYCNWARPKTG